MGRVIAALMLSAGDAGALKRTGYRGMTMDFRQQQSEEEHQQYLIDRLHKLVILQKIKRGLAGNEEA
jgi:hypothetical protein